MSILCGLPLVECVYCLACARWAWKRCLHTAGHDSENWGFATVEEFEPIPRLSMLTMVVVQNRHRLGNIDRKRVRCYAVAPARCMSLNLAVRYADVINSDDFLPRTATPLEDIFKSLFCLPCLLCLRCMRDTCIPEEKMLKDPRRLYAPGRLYHIVERKPFRYG
ncbi:carboxylesterase protein [Spatholobus suberectus]|nr:carboxylesterase protein [Spatholobus suberectus]